MRTRHLNGLLMVAILGVSTAPLYAQRQQQNVAKSFRKSPAVGAFHFGFIGVRFRVASRN
jgi:hypothetical protein